VPARPAPASVPAWIDGLAPDRRAEARALLELVRGALPGAEETLHFRSPTFEVGGEPVCAVGVQKRHRVLYVCDAGVLDDFRRDRARLDLGGGCVAASG
jgi:hypothetical protein